MKAEEMREALISARREPTQGSIYYSPKRGICHRIKELIGKTHVRTQSYRPDGETSGAPCTIAMSSFRNNYLYVQRVIVDTDVGIYIWTQQEGGKWHPWHSTTD